MRIRPLLVAAGLVSALGVVALTGCETTRVNKLHAGFESVSDVTTVPGPNPQYASVVTDIPPVPGSPTGAGPDGMQPVNDNQARKDPGAEKGIPMAPRMQPQGRFIRQ